VAEAGFSWYWYALEKPGGGWFQAASRAIVTRSVYRIMEPKKDTTEDAPKAPPKGSPSEEPVQELRPEDEAKVVERLRELGYIE
jgi:hypothetical protein